MTDEVTYFEVAGFLAQIEDKFAEISDPVERTQKFVERLRQKWPSMTTSQAVAYVQVFRST
jgi:hypothetical protein